jgi:GntR family transcriptional regulator/MocR family aminotransferase
MPKAAPSFGLILPPKDPGEPSYRWLYAALRLEILQGRLLPGARLPSTRDLAAQYGLARGTVVNAFEQLKSEGYIDGSLGSGTYVGKILPESLLQVAYRDIAKPAAERAAQTRRPATLSDYGRRAKLFRNYENRPTRAFRANLPALDLFPVALWTKITQRSLGRISTHQLMGGDPLGYLALRQAVAEYLKSRGVSCQPQQVMIVSGVQQALDLTARLLVNPGDRVCVENPGYSGAVQVFQALGAKIVAAGIDDQGISIRRLPSKAVRLIYVTPGHQFPLGTTMSLARRLALLEWARKSGAVIFEDDYDGEFRYAGRPIPALQGLDTSGAVIYAGSFSKVLFPSLRLGYLVIPSHLLPHFEAIQSLTCRHAPLLEQLALTAFINEGHFGRHLRHMRQVYAERLSVLLEETRRRLAGLLEIRGVEAGLQTVGWLQDGLAAEAAALAAAKRNVQVTPLARVSQGSALPGRAFPGGAGLEALQLGFAAVEAKEIRRGVRELAIALEGERKASA